MAWTHFTDYLNEGDIFTRAQRDELLDAVAERFPDVPTTVEWSPIHAEIQASGLATKQVSFRWGGVTTLPQRLDQLIDLLGSHFLRDESDTFATWSGTNTVTVSAAADEGISFTDWLQIARSELDDARYWNVCRRAIIRLKRVARGWSEAMTENRGIRPSFNTFAEAAADLIAASPSVSSSDIKTYLNLSSNEEAVPPIFRFTVTITSRATIQVPPSASGRAWAYVSRGTLDNYRPMRVQIKIGDAAGDEVSAISVQPAPMIRTKIVIGSGVEAGPQTLRLRFMGFDDAAELESIRGGVQNAFQTISPELVGFDLAYDYV